MGSQDVTDAGESADSSESSSGGTWRQSRAMPGIPDAGFGASLALSADGTTLAVGAPTAKVGTRVNAGLVFVYKWALTSGEWLSDVRVEDSDDGDSNNQFGFSIALTGDGGFLAVGIPFDDRNSSASEVSSNESAKGRVEIRTAESRYEDAKGQKLGEESNQLGYSVALSADGSVFLAGAPLGRKVFWAGRKFIAETGGDWEQDFLAIGNTLTVSRDGTYWASLQRTNFSTEAVIYGKKQNKYESKWTIPSNQGPYAISGNGQYLAVVTKRGGDDSIEVSRIDAIIGVTVESTQVTQGSATGLAMDESGSTLVMCLDGLISIWERSNTEWINMTLNLTAARCGAAVAISADGDKVVAGDPESNTVYTYVRE